MASLTERTGLPPEALHYFLFFINVELMFLHYNMKVDNSRPPRQKGERDERITATAI